MSRPSWSAKQTATHCLLLSGESTSTDRRRLGPYLPLLYIFPRYKDNEKVQASAHRLLLADSLFFLHVVSKKGDGGDTGTYYCVARNEVGKAKSRNATLEVAGK